MSLNQQAVANGLTVNDLKRVLADMLARFPTYDWVGVAGSTKLAFEANCTQWLTNNCVIE